MKAVELALELLEMIGGRNAEVNVGRRVVKHLYLAKEGVLEVGRNAGGSLVIDKESMEPVVAKGLDQLITPLWDSVPLGGAGDLEFVFAKNPLAVTRDFESSRDVNLHLVPIRHLCLLLNHVSQID